MKLAENLKWFHEQGGLPEYNKKVVMIFKSLAYQPFNNCSGSSFKLNIKRRNQSICTARSRRLCFYYSPLSSVSFPLKLISNKNGFY